MKKVIFVAIIATLIAVGCEKTEIINPNLGTEILFSPDLGKLTKAEGEIDATLKDQGFKVSAINAYEDLYTTAVEFNTVYREMDNLQFVYNNGWALQNGQSYFWPGTGKDLVFLAVSSKTGTVEIPEIVQNGFGITGTPETDSEDNNTGAYTGITVNNFTIPDFIVTPPSYVKEAGENAVVGDQTGADDDLMVANVVIQNQDDNDGVTKGKVKLDFSHTLSKVQFVFTTNTTADYPVTVNEVKIEDVINEATLGVGVSFAAESRTSTNTYDWSPSNNTADVDYLAQKIESESENNYEDFVIDYNLSLVANQELPYATWLVIPQSLEGKMVSITYTIADNNNLDAQGNAATSVFTSVFPLYTENLEAWSRNQYVRYKINLSPNLITFDPVVSEDWSNPTDVEHNN